MKPTLVILTLASAGVAQDLGALPDCAKNCLAEFTTGSQIGDCARLDAKCICASDSFISGIACCLADVCDADAQAQAVEFARTFCRTQGVTDLPQSVTCATASGTGTPTTASTLTPATTSASASVTPNAAPMARPGRGGGLCGGLLIALAML